MSIVFDDGLSRFILNLCRPIFISTCRICYCVAMRRENAMGARDWLRASAMLVCQPIKSQL